VFVITFPREHAELQTLSEAAQSAKIGIWNPDKNAQEKSIRNIIQKFDQLTLYEKLKGKAVDGKYSVHSGVDVRCDLIRNKKLSWIRFALVLLSEY